MALLPFGFYFQLLRRITLSPTLKPWNKKTGKDDVVPEADGSWTCFIQDRAMLGAHFTDYIQNCIARNNHKP